MERGCVMVGWASTGREMGDVDVVRDDDDRMTMGWGIDVLRQRGDVVPIFAPLSIRRTLTHSTMAAPELSMQLSMD
jgi:hypothetical protein